MILYLDNRLKRSMSSTMHKPRSQDVNDISFDVEHQLISWGILLFNWYSAMEVYRHSI